MERDGKARSVLRRLVRFQPDHPFPHRIAFLFVNCYVMDATLDGFGRETNLAWWSSITQPPVPAMLMSQVPHPKITGGRWNRWWSGSNFLCCMGSTTFLSIPSREPRMLSRKSWCPTWKLAWPQGSILMCRSIHEIKPWTCAVGILIGWFGIACIGPRATTLGSSPPSTSTSISTWTVATSFQMARFHKIIWGQVGMPSQDLKTKIHRKFGAFLSNDFTSLLLPLAVWRFLPHGVRRISRSGWGNRTPWRPCRSTSTTSTWPTTVALARGLRSPHFDHRICRSGEPLPGSPTEIHRPRPSTTTWSPTPTSWHKPLNNDLDRNFQLYSSDSVKRSHIRHSRCWAHWDLGQREKVPKACFRYLLLTITRCLYTCCSRALPRIAHQGVLSEWTWMTFPC